MVNVVQLKVCEEVATEIMFRCMGKELTVVAKSVSIR